MSLEFWITSILVTATPGTGALFTMSAGLTRGVRAGLIAAFGCTFGILPHMVLALSGAAAVLAASSVAFDAIKWLGVAYLLFMAWTMWRQTGVFTQDSEQEAVSASRVIGSAVLINLLNPKLTLFFFVFLPMFVDPRSDGAVSRMTALGAIFMAITLVIFAVYGICAGWLRRHVIDRPVVMRWIGRSFALSFLALAVVLASTEQ